jgi:hypothetical protein
MVAAGRGAKSEPWPNWGNKRQAGKITAFWMPAVVAKWVVILNFGQLIFILNFVSQLAEAPADVQNKDYWLSVDGNHYYYYPHYVN